MLLIILISVWVLNHRLSIFDLPASTTPTFDSYVKNDSWNTEFSTETPYKKGDVLEYLFMFSGNSGSLFLLNTQNIATLLDEPTFELDGNPVSSISSLSVGE